MLIFTYRSSLVTMFFWFFFAMLIIAGGVCSSFAQNAWGGKRATRVEVAEINTRVLTDLADVQGRVIEGPSYSVTATTDAITNIGAVRLGDLVTSGDVIATQDSAKLELQLKKCGQLLETELRLADSEAELKAEKKLLDFMRLRRRCWQVSKRAEGSLQIMLLPLMLLKWQQYKYVRQYFAFDPSIINSTNKSTTKIFRVAIDQVRLK